jgi:hypothetical protein
MTDNIEHKEAALVKSQSTAAMALLGPLTRSLLLMEIEDPIPALDLSEVHVVYNLPICQHGCLQHLGRCSRCPHAPEYQSGDSRVVFYCSRECQVMDWPNHTLDLSEVHVVYNLPICQHGCLQHLGSSQQYLPLLQRQCVRAARMHLNTKVAILELFFTAAASVR